MPAPRPSCCAQCGVLSRAELIGIARRPQKLLAPAFPALFVIVISIYSIGNDPRAPEQPGAPSSPQFPYELGPGLANALAPYASRASNVTIGVSPPGDACAAALAQALGADLAATSNGTGRNGVQLTAADSGSASLRIDITNSPSWGLGAGASCSSALGGANASWEYSLVTPQAASPNTAKANKGVMYYSPFGLGDGPSEFAYLSWGSTLAFQAWVDGAIHRLQGIPAATAEPFELGRSGAFSQRVLPLAAPDNPFRAPADPITSALTPGVPVIGPIIFWAIAASSFTADTNGGMRESLRIRGLRPAAYWGAKLLAMSILAAPAALALTGAVFLVRQVVFANVGLVFASFFACLVSGIPFAAAISQLVRRSTVAFAVVNGSFIPVFGIWAVVSVVVTDTSAVATALACVLPQWSFIAAFSTIGILDTQRGGLTAANIGDAPFANSVPVSLALVGTACVFVLWTAITVLVDAARVSAAAGGDGPFVPKDVSSSNPAVYKLDVEGTLGKSLDDCIVVTGAVRVFHGVKGSRPPVELHNDDLRAKALGLDVSPSDGPAPSRLRGCCRPAGAPPSFHAPWDLMAVAGVDVVVAPSQITCLLGHNGSGKTTFLSMLTASIPRSGGRIRYFGTDLTGSNAPELCREIGYCPQANLLVEGMTAREHLAMYWGVASDDSERRASRIATVLEEVGLSDDANRAVDMFSGGMRRKLAVAGALLRDECRVLLLDEPTSGCDPSTRRRIWDLILAARRAGKCVVMTTHELSEAELLADQVVVMKRGRVEACGTKLALKGHFTDGYDVSARVPRAGVDALVEAAEAEDGVTVAVGAEARRAKGADGSDGSDEAEDGDVAAEARPGEGGKPAAGAGAAKEAAPAADGPASADDPAAGDGADASDDGSVDVRVSVPWDAVSRLPALMGSLSDAGARGVSLVQDTLESVFLAIAQADEKPSDGASVEEVEERLGDDDEDEGCGGLCGGRKVSDDSVEADGDEGSGDRSLDGDALRVTPRPSAWMQVRTLVWARARNPESKAVLVIPVLYVFAMVALLAVIDTAFAPSNEAPEPVTLGPGPLLGQAFAAVTAWQSPQAEQTLLAEQTVCAAIGKRGPATLPAVAAPGGAPSAPGFAGCDGVATVADGAPTASRAAYTVAGTTTLYVYSSVSALQTDALATARFHTGVLGATTAPTRQLAGGLVFPVTPLNASLYGSVAVRPQMGVSVLANASLPAAAAVLRGALTQSVSRLGSGAGAATVGFTARPAPVPRPSMPNLGIIITFPILMGIAMSNGLSLGAGELARDNDNGMRSKMSVMGLRSYILGLVVADVGMMGTIMVLATALAGAIGTSIIGDSRWPGFLLGSLMSVVSISLCNYVIVSGLKLREQVASAVVPIVGMLLGIVPFMLASAPSWGGDAADLAETQRIFGLLSFIPQANYYFILDTLARMGTGADATVSAPFTAAEVLGWEAGVGYHLMWAAISIAALSVFLYAAEHSEELHHAASACLDSLCGRGHEHGGPAGSSSAPPARESKGGPDESVRAELARADAVAEEEGGMAGRGLTLDIRTRTGESRRVLDDWTLGIRRGEVVTLLGPAGAGKTTAMRALVGDKRTGRGAQGDVSVGGRPLAAMPGHVGYCPQDDAMWPTLTPEVHMQVFASIRGVPVARRRAIVEGVSRSTDLKRHMEKPTSALSGGNKRKLGLATAVMGLPTAVVYDEPSTGVDPAARRAIWAIVDAARPCCAQLVSTHSMDEAAALGDRVAIMANGRLLTIGTPDDLKDRFCDAYFVEVELAPGASADSVLERLREDVDGLRVRDRVGGVLKLEAPRAVDDRAALLSSLFGALGRLGEEDVRHYSVTDPSLEEAFLAVVSADGAEIKA